MLTRFCVIGEQVGMVACKMFVLIVMLSLAMF